VLRIKITFANTNAFVLQGIDDRPVSKDRAEYPLQVHLADIVAMKIKHASVHPGKDLRDLPVSGVLPV
jgi:hypothetical protein